MGDGENEVGELAFNSWCPSVPLISAVQSKIYGKVGWFKMNTSSAMIVFNMAIAILTVSTSLSSRPYASIGVYFLESTQARLCTCSLDALSLLRFRFDGASLVSNCTACQVVAMLVVKWVDWDALSLVSRACFGAHGSVSRSGHKDATEGNFDDPPFIHLSPTAVLSDICNCVIWYFRSGTFAWNNRDPIRLLNGRLVPTCVDNGAGNITNSSFQLWCKFTLKRTNTADGCFVAM